MNKAIDLFKRSSALRYIFAGGASYAIELAALLSSIHLLRLSEPVGISLGFGVGLIVSFLLQKILAFKNRDQQISAIGRQGLYYAVLVGANYIFTLAFTTGLSPILGLAVARTMALAITTVWNYFIYKKVIFSNDISRKNQNNIRSSVAKYLPATTLLAVGVIGVSLLSYLAITGISSRPIADDFAYFSQVELLDGALPATADHYQHHNGRMSQAFLAYVLYDVFGERATRVAPALLLASLAASLTLLIYLLIPKLSKFRAITSLAYGAVLTSAIMLTLPGTYDSLYWLTSSTVYIPSLITVILTVCLMTLIVLDQRWQRLRITLLLAPIIVLSQLFGEGGAVTAIVISGAVSCWLIFKKHFKQLIVVATVFASQILGFLINYLSPATRSRQSNLNAPLDINVFIENTINPYRNMIDLIEWWHVCIAFAIGLSLASMLHYMGTVRISLKNILLALVVLLGTFSLPIVTFGINAYVAGDWFPVRNYTVPSALFFISLVLLSFLFACFILNYIKELYRLQYLIILVTIALLAISAPFAIYKAHQYNQFMAIRDINFTKRSLSIEQQKKSNPENIIIESLPVILKNNTAEDIFLLPRSKDWILNIFNTYYGIDKTSPANFNGDYCLNSTYVVTPEYLCVNRLEY